MTEPEEPVRLHLADAVRAARSSVVPAKARWLDVPFEQLEEYVMAAIRRVVREELRRCEVRPPVPGPGAWRWNHEADGWESQA